MVCDGDRDVQRANDVGQRMYRWLTRELDGAAAPVEPLAIAGGHLAARHAADLCMGPMSPGLIEHCFRFASWMYRRHRKHRKKAPEWRDVDTSGLQGLGFFKTLEKFATAWVSGHVTPPQALERLQAIRSELNAKDTIDGTDGDVFWETLVLADPDVTLYRRFKDRDHALLTKLGQTPGARQGSYHSDALATAGRPRNTFALAHARIRIGAPVVVFPILLFADSSRARECEFLLLDVNLSVIRASASPIVPPSPPPPQRAPYVETAADKAAMAAYLANRSTPSSSSSSSLSPRAARQPETVLDLETTWGRGDFDHHF